MNKFLQNKLFFFLSVSLCSNLVMSMQQLTDGAFSLLPLEIVQRIFHFVEHEYPWEDVMQYSNIRTVCKRWLSVLGSMDDILKYLKVPRLHFAAMTNNAKAIMFLKIRNISSLREPDCRFFRAAHYALATRSHRALRVLKMGHALDTGIQNSEKLKQFVVDSDPESLKILCAPYDREITAEELINLSQNEVTVEFEEVLSRMTSPLVIGEFFNKCEQIHNCHPLFCAYLSFAFISPLEAALFETMNDGNAVCSGDFFDLFKLHANPNACDELGKTLLTRACTDPGFRQILTQLLTCPDIDVNMSSKDKSMYTPLHVAVLCNNIEAVQTLLNFKDGEGKYRVNINARDGKGNTPLQIGLEKYNDDTFKIFNLFLKHGADMNIKSEKGHAPIHTAVIYGARKILKGLIGSRTCDLEAITTDGYTALGLATMVDQHACVKLLLKNKVNAFCTNDDGDTCLHTAAEHGSIKSMDELIPYLYRVINAQNDYGFAPLHIAVKKKYTESDKLLINKAACAQLLINKGAAINVRTKKGDTPLHYAASNDNVQCIELLINHGACVNIKNNDEAIVKEMHVGGYTPLHYAAHLGKLNAVKKLVELGADIHAKTTLKKNALELAYDFGYPEIGKYLAE